MLRQRTNHVKDNVVFISKLDNTTGFPDEGIPWNIASGQIKEIAEKGYLLRFWFSITLKFQRVRHGQQDITQREV